MKIPGRKFLYIFPAILLCLMIFLLRSFLYNRLVDPIARIIWLIVRSLLSIDQEILWIILIILVAFVSLLIFPNDQQYKIRSSYIDSNRIEDRVTFWKLKFLSADKNTGARISLQQSLENLAASINGLYGNTQMVEVLLPMKGTKPWRYHWSRLKHLFEKKSSKGDEILDNELERNLSQLLDSMESLVEMQND